MLARFTLGLLLFGSTALADCLPDPAVVKTIHTVRDTPCYGVPECLIGQLENIERLLGERPGSIPLHRIRQDLALEAGSPEREATRDALIEQYRDHPALSAQARQYLVARLEGDEAGLRGAAVHFPWANLDLMRRRFDLDYEALVGAVEAERLLGAFVAECSDASVVLADEAGQLAVSAHWPVWSKVRRSLLAMEPPPWEHLDKLLIRAGLLQDGSGDPAQRLLAELEAETEDGNHDDAGYWLYRARIHHQARDVDAALEANTLAREIDPCRQLPPLQRIRPDETEEFSADWLASVSEQVLDCPPDVETYQSWMFAVSQQPHLLEKAPLARIRRAIESGSLGHDAPALEKALARIDIRSDHEPEAAWARLDRFFEKSLISLVEASPGTDRAAMAVSIALNALDYVKVALENDFPQQAKKWWSSADALFDEHEAMLRQDPRWEGLMTHIDAARSELEWLKARKEQRHADAVLHALDARANRLPWIDMDEVLAAWRAAGGTEAGFERLLAAWDLELPAEWRGWRRLDAPLEAFEQDDLQGRTWTLADFEGKRTLLNLWAIWCGPCLIELPKVQALHERYRDDPGVQVLTVNLHDAPGVARELMRREGWNFPVLMLDEKEPLFDDVGIPRNWLVDAEGVRRWEQTGFVPAEADHWVEDIASLLEQMD